jgi:hypothetical protein
MMAMALLAALPLRAEEDLRAALAACRAEPDDAKRLACYDRQADQGTQAATSGIAAAATAGAAAATATTATDPAGAAAAEAAMPKSTAAPSATVGAAAADTAGAAAATAASATDKFGYSRGVSPQEVDQQKKVDKEQGLDEISATITNLGTQPRGEYVITLDNGQVWAQKVADGRFRLKIGDQVKIRAGSLGAYFMSVGSSDRTTRVTRTR